MEHNNHVYIGHRHEWGGDAPFGIDVQARRQHVYVIGQTGSGKSTLLRNLILQDIEDGRGVALIDPHGDLAADILEHIAPSRTNDVVYFNPSDLHGRSSGPLVMQHSLTSHLLSGINMSY
jgi:DNA helicase HerA-like ATPase